MREISRQPGDSEINKQDLEAAEAPERAETGEFSLPAADDEVRGLEVRMSREIGGQVREVKEQIARAFEHARRDQDRFADQARTDPELSSRLARFLEFQARLKQGSY